MDIWKDEVIMDGRRQVFEMQVNGRLNNALSEGSNIVQRGIKPGVDNRINQATFAAPPLSRPRHVRELK